jgi:hypothetical protein
VRNSAASSAARAGGLNGSAARGAENGTFEREACDVQGARSACTTGAAIPSSNAPVRAVIALACRVYRMGCSAIL